MFLVRVFLLLSIFVTATTNAKEKIVLTNGEWVPFQSEHLPNFGVASMLVSEIFKNKGIEVSYIFRPWKRSYEEARIGKANGTLMWRLTEDRQQYFYYSDPIIESTAVMFHLKTLDFTWNKDSDLTPYRIGGTLGYQYTYDNIPGINIERVAKDTLNFEKLLLNRIDLFGLDKIVGYDIIYRDFSPDQAEQFSYSESPHKKTAYHLILNKKDENHRKLILIFNRELKRLKENGRYQEIIQQQLKIPAGIVQ
jgi:polar amino acid transport system substrate-binding protein